MNFSNCKEEQDKLNNLASEAMIHLANVEKTIKLFEVFLSGSQQDMFVNTYTNLVNLYFIVKRYDDAIGLLEKVRSTLPQDLEIFFVEDYHAFKVAIFIERNEPELALAELDLGVRFFPESAVDGIIKRPVVYTHLWGLAITRFGQMEYQLAMRLVDLCLKEFGPIDEGELSIASETYAYNGRAKEGLVLIDKNLNRIDCKGIIFISQGLCYERISSWDLSLAAFQKAKEMLSFSANATRDINVHISRILRSKAG